MAELKTKVTDADIAAFLLKIDDAEKRRDCETLMAIMARITGEEARIWGDSIIGFGSYHYKSASGREGDWFRMGLSPRKQNITIYLLAYLDKFPELLARLGKYKTGKSCIYIKSLKDIDLGVLEELCRVSLDHLMGAEK